MRGAFRASVYLAGLRIPDEDVRELAELVDEPTRSFFEKSLALDTGVVALAIGGPRAHPTMPGLMRLQSFAAYCV